MFSKNLNLFIWSILLHFCVLTEFSVAQTCKSQNLTKRVICYYANWAQWRPAPANIKPTDFDPCLCTHVFYSFVKISKNALVDGFEEASLFPQMNQWKTKNPNLKISFSVGGWNEGSTNFLSIVSTSDNQKLFCENVINFVRKYNIDGFDIDWEYPTTQQKDAYTNLIKTCYYAFLLESFRTGKPRILLSAATAPDYRMNGLDLPQLNKYFDFINPMSYDLHGSWDGNTMHHSPLYGPEGAASTIQKYIAGGISPEKLNLGFATYGRTRSIMGQYTKESGILAYYEVCKMKSANTERFDEVLKVPNAIVNMEKTFYDNTRSVIEKTKWALANRLGGVFTWDASLDDFNGLFCSEGKFPLISAALSTITDNSPTTAASTTTTTATTTTTTTQPRTTTTLRPLTTTTVAPSLTTKSNLPECEGRVGFFKYISSCQKFLFCNGASSSLMSCPNGYFFNDSLKSCDFISNVRCPN